MVEYVHSGDKIQASQYNALVDAMVGPTNATADQPFTQTKNGVVINGGLGRQTTKAASTVPAMFEVSYGNGYVGAGYSTYSQGDIDANRFNGVFLNIGSWDTLAYNGFVLGNGVAMPTIPVFAIIDPTSNNAAVVPYTSTLADTTPKGKLPLCTSDQDAGYAFVQVVDNGTAGKDRNGDFVLLVGDFTKIGGQSGSDIKTVGRHQIRAAIRGINIYENCEDVRVVQGGVLWRHNVIAGLVGSNIPHLSYTVGTQYVDMLPDSYVNSDGEPEQQVWTNALMDVKLKSIGIVPREQMGFAELQNTNTFELYNFDKLSSDISTYYELSSEGLSCYDVLVKHKKPHPYAEDDPTYEGQAEADLEYVAVSCLVPPGDTNASKDGTINTSLSSVELTTINHNAFYELFGFQKKGTLDSSDLSSGGVEVVVRDSHSTNGVGARVNYVALSTITESLSNLTQISGDYNVPAQQQWSIETRENPNGRFHEIYGFSNPTYLLSSDLTSYAGALAFLLRDEYGSTPSRGKVSYTRFTDLKRALASDSPAISGDYNVIPNTQKSIETLSGQSGAYHQLYNWAGSSVDQSHVISAAFGETRYFPFQDGTGSASDLGNAAHILTRPRAGARDLHYDAYGIRLPKVSPTDVTEELYDLILSGGGTDISAVRQIVIDTLDDSDAKGPLSSNLNDCFWPQGGDNSNCYGSRIGDSQKRKVIDLDGNTLHAVGNNQSVVDWAGDVCYDSQGTQSILWDGRGLVDSGSQWALDWENRQCFDSTATPTVDWENGALKVPASGNNSVDWKAGVLYDPNNGNESLNWDVGYAQDPTGSGVTVNWNTGQLWSDNNTRTLNWKNRVLEGNWRTNGNFTVGGNGSTLTIGNTTITEAQLQQLLALLSP